MAINRKDTKIIIVDGIEASISKGRINGDGLIYCGKCEEHKNVSEYYISHTHKGRNYITGHCRACMRGENSPNVIYELTLNMDNIEYKYVGSSINLGSRLSSHLAYAKRGTHKVELFNELYRKCAQCNLSVRETDKLFKEFLNVNIIYRSYTITEQELRVKEYDYITVYSKRYGDRLLNNLDKDVNYLMYLTDRFLNNGRTMQELIRILTKSGEL